MIMDCDVNVCVLFFKAHLYCFVPAPQAESSYNPPMGGSGQIISQLDSSCDAGQSPRGIRNCLGHGWKLSQDCVSATESRVGVGV